LRARGVDPSSLSIVDWIEKHGPEACLEVVRKRAA
jgi:hypothetical protein